MVNLKWLLVIGYLIDQNIWCWNMEDKAQLYLEKMLFVGFINGNCCNNQMKIYIYSNQFNWQFTLVERNQCIFNIFQSILIKHQRIISNYPQNKRIDYFICVIKYLTFQMNTDDNGNYTTTHC